MGAFRTTTTLLGPLFSFLQLIVPLSKDIILVSMKVSFWLTGILLLTAIIDQLHRFLAPKVAISLFHGLLFNALVALPVTSLALKTLNYDLLSMLFGILGSLWLVAGICSGKRQILFASIMCLTLAAHEKLIASPILWLALILCSWRLTGVTQILTSPQIIRKVTRSTATCFSFSLSLIVISFLFVRFTHGADQPHFTAQQLFMCFESASWPLLRLIPVSIFPENIKLPDIEIVKIFTHMIVMFSLLLISVLLITFCYPCLSKCIKLLRKTAQIQIVIVYARLGMLLLLIITGIISTFALDVNNWPQIPVAAGHYVPGATFNGIAFHYGASNFLAHTAASVAFACAVFINALPTMILLLLIAGSAMRAHVARRECITRLSTGFDLLSIFFLSTPLIYGALQIPLFPRYLNLFLLGTVATIIPDVFKLRIAAARPLRIVCAVAGLLLLVGEIFPFLPLGSSFRPIWSNYKKSFNAKPCFGKATPWYPGWGEELLVAFTQILRSDSIQNPIRLHYNFPASLIGQSNNVSLHMMAHDTMRTDYSYTELDYYIISRNGISSFADIRFPQDTRPIFTISDRGFTKAWIYLGSDLGKSGFRF
jgi:hypothetical protein